MLFLPRFKLQGLQFRLDGAPRQREGAKEQCVLKLRKQAFYFSETEGEYIYICVYMEWLMQAKPKSNLESACVGHDCLEPCPHDTPTPAPPRMRNP
jgi:hypothetical protein